MQVHGFDYTELFLPVATYTSTGVLIVLTLYNKEEGLVAEICDAELSFLHPAMPVEMFTE